MKRLLILLVCLPWWSYGSGWPAAAQCAQPDSQYRHRLVVMPTQLVGPIPVAWRRMDQVFDDFLMAVLARNTGFDLKYMNGLSVAGLSSGAQRAAVRAVGQREVAQYLLLPRFDAPLSLQSNRATWVDRGQRWLKRQMRAQEAVSLPLILEVYDLRRGTLVSQERIPVSADMPKRAGQGGFAFGPHAQLDLTEFSRVLATQLACQPVSVPIIRAQGKEVEIQAGADLGIQAGDVLDVELVKAFEFGGQYGYSSRAIDAKLTIVQVLPERSLASLSDNAEVLNLQPGDLALAR